MNKTDSWTPGSFGGAVMIALFAVPQGFFFSYLRQDVSDQLVRWMVFYGPLFLAVCYILIVELLKFHRISLGRKELPLLSLDTILSLVIAIGSPYILLGFYESASWFVRK